MDYVIIGAGPAGVIAAETLRKVDPGAGVTIIGEESEPPYSRMALPYYLTRQVPESGTYLRRDKEHFTRNAIEVRQDKAASIDARSRTVALASGGSIAYDKLLLATGSQPIAPAIPGIDAAGVYPCWTLADARHIAAGARPGAKVVLMGAGFIGCIILEALARSGAALTVVELEDRMVPRMMNNKAGNLIKQWCSKNGVDVHTSTKVIEINAGEPLGVRLDNGSTLEADLVVSATGVRPNTALLDDSGIETEQGILVNRHLQTSDPNIFAAGDVAKGRDFSTGEYTVQAIQPTASDHGQLAARNMLGANIVHQGSVNMNVLDTIGLISSSFGLWMGVAGGEEAELYNPDRFRYLNLQFDEDILVGATSLGLTQHVGVLRGLIQSRTRLGSWKEKLVKDPTRVMEAYLARTQAVGFNSAAFAK